MHPGRLFTLAVTVISPTLTGAPTFAQQPHVAPAILVQLAPPAATAAQLQPPALPPQSPTPQLQPPSLPQPNASQLQPPPLPGQPAATGQPQPPANPLGPPAPPPQQQQAGAVQPASAGGATAASGAPGGNIQIDLQIIGFGVDNTTKAQLEEAAKAGNGRYLAAENETELVNAMGQATGLGTGLPPVVSDPATRQAVDLVLDVSNSMWGQIQGRAKIDIAREAIGTLLSTWDPNTDLGLVAYGHNRAGDCGDIETLLKVEPLDAQAFNTLVANLTPKGKTPLTEAVRRAAQDLGITDRPASVILFSDGIETCGGDPCALAKELKTLGVNFTAHVIGFSVAANEAQLACLAEGTGGLFLTADTEPQLAQALTTVANRAANPVATDLVTLEAVDLTSGAPVGSGVVWTVTSLASEDMVPLTAGVARPALPLAPGQYTAEARVGTAVGQAQFTVVAHQAQIVQVRLGLSAAAPGQGVGTCSEPNDEFSAPAMIGIASGIRDNILPTGDQDFCGFDVPEPGLLTLSASAAPSSLQLVARVNDIDRLPIVDWTAQLLPGAAPVEADLPTAGRYILQVADSYNDQSAPDGYALDLAFTPVEDVTEPNDSVTSPATLPLDSPVEVAIFPKGEHNFLSVEVEDQGELTLIASAVPKPIEATLRIYGPDLALLRDWQSAPAGVDNTLVADLPVPGRYVVELADSYDDARSPQPLILTAKFVASADASEPNDGVTQATPLTLASPLAFTILPKGDNDFFGFDTPHRGHMTATAKGIPDIEVAMRLYDSDKNLVRDWAAAPAAGVDLSFEADLPRPGHYWLQVADSYNDQRSVESSALTVTVAPAEDAMEPNDRQRDAEPLPLGVPVPATILPRGDHDYFVIDAAGGTSLTVRAEKVPKNLEVTFRLYDRNLNVVKDWTGPPASGVDTQMTFDIATQGRYFLEVVDGYDDQSSPDAFLITASQP